MNLYMTTPGGIILIDENRKCKKITRFKKPYMKNFVYFIPAESLDEAVILLQAEKNRVKKRIKKLMHKDEFGKGFEALSRR